MKKIHFIPYTSNIIRTSRQNDELLDEILSSKCVLFPQKINKPIVLYGAGNLGVLAKDFFEYLRIPYLYVVDTKAEIHKKEEAWKDIPIVYPNQVSEEDKQRCLLVVCIVTTPLIGLRNRLGAEGWNDIIFFYDVAEAYKKKHPLNNGWFLNPLKKKEKELIKRTYNSFFDSVSKAHYLQFLAWRRLRVELLFSNKKFRITQNDRFLIPEIIDVLGADETFVDGGAHTGGVIENFLKAVKRKYKNIYAFEPDKFTLSILRGVCKKIPRTKIFGDALSDRKRPRRFYEGFGFASRLGGAGNYTVNSVTLDEVHIKPTFVKIHLEGGELAALRGAIQTIQKERPIVVATVYHNDDGVYKTPLYLIDRIQKYQYYFRLHSWGGTGAVLYAIPRERQNK